MKKKVKTQNGREPTNDSYRKSIRTIHGFDEHITELTERRDNLIGEVKLCFGKTNENIEFELNKLKGK